MEKSRLRWLWMLALVILFCGMEREVYGQRVYANRDVINADYNAGILGIGTSGVIEREKAFDNNLSTYSQLKLAVLGSPAWQTLRFPDNKLPLQRTPLYLKLALPASTLSLLSNISLVRTLGGGPAPIQVGTNYSGQQLLDLLGLFSENTPVEIEIPGDVVDFDGVKLQIGGLLAVGATARYYELFYIVPPQLASQKVTLCDATSYSVTISNFQSGYTYRLYNAETGGASLDQTITNTLAISSAMEGVFWLEAREGDLYPSARTKIEIVRNKISNNTISGNQSICQENTPSLINGVTPTAVGATIAYQWQRKTTGEYADISGATSHNFQPSTLAETTTFRRAVTATLNGVSCVAYSNDITVTIKPRPPAPNIILIPNSQY